MLTAEALDAACAPLLAEVRARRVVPEAELAAVVPPDHGDVHAWLSCYGQCRVWLAAPRPDAAEDPVAAADSVVMQAMREAPTPVDGTALQVYPKSFEALMQLRVLDAQYARQLRGLLDLIGEDATLASVDASVPVATSVAYVLQLIVWAWTHPGPGLPWDVTEAVPAVPAEIQALGPEALLAVAGAVHAQVRVLAALDVLTDPQPAGDGGRRPSWSALLDAVGADAHIDPRELAVGRSLASVLARARLAAQRRAPAPGST